MLGRENNGMGRWIGWEESGLSGGMVEMVGDEYVLGLSRIGFGGSGWSR